MANSIFGAEKVIKQNINGCDLVTYFVDFELQDDGSYQYRWDTLINLMQTALVEFAYGLHEGPKTPNEKIIDKLVDSAKSIYKIKEYEETRQLYEN